MVASFPENQGSAISPASPRAAASTAAATCPALLIGWDKTRLGTESMSPKKLVSTGPG